MAMVGGWRFKMCVRMRGSTQPQTCLRMAVCKCMLRKEVGRNREEGRKRARERGRAVEGFRGKMWSSIAGSRSREKIIGR